MDTVITVRRAERSDLGAIDDVLARSYPRLLKNDYPPSVLVTALPLISRAKPELIASGTYFVAEADGAVVGAGGWTPGAPPGQRSLKRVGNIRHVVTDHRHVRRGIGRTLMSEIIHSAKSAGMLRLDCLSTRTAVPFYKTCGFEVVQEVLVPLQSGIDFPSVAMRMEIRT